MALVLESSSPPFVLDEPKNNTTPGGNKTKAATLATGLASSMPPPTKTTASTSSSPADNVNNVPVELLVMEQTPSGMAADDDDMEVGEPPVALKTPTLQAALASGCSTNNNNNNNKAMMMIPAASGPLVSPNTTTTVVSSSSSPAVQQRSSAAALAALATTGAAAGSPEEQQQKSSSVLRSKTPDPTSPSLLEPNVAVEILARHSLSFTKKNSLLDNDNDNEHGAVANAGKSSAATTAQQPDHVVPTTATTTTTVTSQVPQAAAVIVSSSAPNIVTPPQAPQPLNRLQQYRRQASSSAGNLIDDLTCFVCSERRSQSPQQLQQSVGVNNVGGDALANTKPKAVAATPKPLIRQPTPPQHRERPTRIPPPNNANQQQQATPPPNHHSSNESIVTINTNVVTGAACNPLGGEQNGTTAKQSGPSDNKSSSESAQSRTISFLSVFTKPLLACSADLPDQIKKVQTAVGTVVNGGLEGGLTSKQSDLSYVDSFEMDEIMQLQRMTSWNTLETNNTICTEYSDEGDARAAAGGGGESNNATSSQLGSPAALNSSSSDGNWARTAGGAGAADGGESSCRQQQPIRFDDDGNPIPAVLMDLTLEMREQRAKSVSVRRKRLVKFSYPPISSLKECPRPDPADLPRLYFSEEELNQIEDDRESTFTADDVEVVCVSTSDSSHDNHHQNNNKEQSPQHDSLATAGSTGDDSHHPSFPHLATPRAGQMWSSKKKTTTFVDTSAVDKQADTDYRGRQRQRPVGDSRKKPKRPQTPGPGGRNGGGGSGNSSNQPQRTDTLSNVGSDSSTGEKRLIKSVQIYLRERSRERCARP